MTMREPPSSIRPTLLAAVLLLAACRPGPQSEPATGAGDTMRTPPPASSTDGAGSADENPRTGETAAAGPSLLDFHYHVLGTEPFWGVEVTPDSLVYTTPESDPQRFRVTKVRRWEDHDVLSGEADGRTIEVAIERGACSDAMSDRRYAYTSRVVVDGRELAGCAFERTPDLAAAAKADPVSRAGLRIPVEQAREIRRHESSFERHVGSLAAKGDSTAMFAAHFEGDDVRMIEFRISRRGQALRETTYYFAGRGGASPAPSLVDGEMPAAAGGKKTWFLLGYDQAGKLTGRLVEVNGAPVDPPAGLAEEELKRARELVAAARRARG